MRRVDDDKVRKDSHMESMKFASVLRASDDPATASLAEASLLGWAPDGGMFWPCAPPQLGPVLLQWVGLSYPQLCTRFLQLFTSANDSELSHSDIEIIVEHAFGAFGHHEVVPLASVNTGDGVVLHIGELWHGPTLAFKDLGMAVLGRVLDHLLSLRDDRLTLLVGTSGDTGSAAMEVTDRIPWSVSPVAIGVP